MKLQEALESIGPVVGLTSLIGAPESVSTEQVASVKREEAEAKLRSLEERRDGARSDAAYWGYVGQIAYWSAIVDLLKAAELVGPDNLPDIEPPDLTGKVVMDAAGSLQSWGDRVLRAAEERKGHHE